MLRNLIKHQQRKRNYSFSSLNRLREIYQRKGHEVAKINPLESSKINASLFEIFENQNYPILVGHKKVETVNDLKQVFDEIYCSKVGFEISHLPENELEWLIERIESFMTMNLSAEAKKGIARLLIETEAFDLFMQKRFNQVKRYGLEGCESTAVVFDFILKTAVDIDHVMVTMPHRGRLNLMTNLMSYPAEAIFHKLLGNSELPENLKGSADVLSHLSLQNKVTIAGNENGLVTLLPNPSHLEAVNSVGLGATYAYKKYKIPNEKCLSVQFHGDAAFTGQGVVSECLQLSKLPNFSVGGTIHIICINQLGFTTPADYGRSSKYASDPAKAISAPILHVNADEPEEVAKISCIAMEYQRKFKKDVVIDLIGWRKRGHNELDEPMFTQPQMYKSINERSSTAQKYAKLVIQEEMKNIEEKSFKDLDAAVIKAKDYKPQLIGIQKDWKLEEQETGVPKDLLIESGIRSVSIPDDFNVHFRLQNHHIDSRLTQIKGGKVDWATAEAMAIGSLISDGFNVRLSGQDVARGTFSHRHLKFYDQIDGKEICPFENWKSEGKLELAPSNLSEFGVLGFEYGLSIVSGNKVLPIWEAQFGDFFNGAQIIFDTFLSSGEEKWGLESNLTVILPHGFDGAGPEHSSCRIERFLQACDESEKGNWIVANPTTPANYLHLLRRQMKRSYVKPLIIIGPKTLLRSPQAVSDMKEMEIGTRFKPILINQIGKSHKKLIFVSGKFYYEIAKVVKNGTLVRIEELNPFPFEEVREKVKGEFNEIIWCQEEPRNMGAFSFVHPKLVEVFGKPVKYVGRKSAAAPAAGISSRHKLEYSEILTKLG